MKFNVLYYNLHASKRRRKEEGGHRWYRNSPITCEYQQRPLRFRLEERSHGKNVQSLAEQFSYLHIPRPFKNPNYTKNVNRRAKNLKAVLAQERERERAERERRRLEKMEGNAMDVDGEEEEVPTCESPSYPHDRAALSHPHFASGIRHLD